jgi:CRP-like cAMP-binding protein
MPHTMAQIQPFSFLDQDSRDRLARHLTTHHVDPGTRLIAAGASDTDVFLLIDGQVEAIDPETRRIGVIDPGHYFGEWTALFGLPRRATIRAITRVTVQRFPGDLLVDLLQTQPAFAQGLGSILRDKQAIFIPFERFLSALRHDASEGHIALPQLLQAYRNLNSALHQGCHDTNIDFSALGYAVARLPKNIGSTLQLLLTEKVPYLYATPSEIFSVIPTSARRRSVWEIMPGKSLILLRDGWSDLVDVVSCLCIYAIEARKIRHRMRNPTLYAALRSGQSSAMATLPFSEQEQASMRRIWPDLREALIAVQNHHEDVSISVYKSVNNYNSAHSEEWTSQLIEATRQLTGRLPQHLPADYEVHIISSNTHSVGNCLSSWLHQNTDVIEAWGRVHCPEVSTQDWFHAADRIVALSRAYFDAHPQATAERTASDTAGAVITLDETAHTGIGVQLFALNALTDRQYDPTLPDPSPERNGMILNIDYAFGQQAESIIGALIVLFGQRIRSVNVLGKAGGLEGQRGDVFVATRFVEQEDDALHVPTVNVNIDRLKSRIPDRSVRCGPVLTVLGTVMQNRIMLNYYRRLWGCVGLEMEGSYYCRKLLRSQARGVLKQDVALRFLYYVSDLPLHQDQNLSGSMRAQEGIPPLYAVTREVLTAILEPSGSP